MLGAIAVEEMLIGGDPERAAELAEKSLADGHLLSGDAIAVLPAAVTALTLVRSGRSGPCRSGTTSCLRCGGAVTSGV